MYFGHKDVVPRPPELCDAVSCALDILDTQLCQQNGDSFKDGDFTSQSLLIMIRKASNKELYCSPVGLDFHPWDRLSLFYFIHNVYEIVFQEENE